MKINPEIIGEAIATADVRPSNQHVTVCFRGALRSQVRIPGQSKRVVSSFRKQWGQVTGFSSAHSE
jgi:hypothetical protein